VAGAERYLDRPRTKVRRKDRALVDEEWIDLFLRTAPYGHLATCWNGEPLLHSNLFWYDGEALFWHTAGVGKLRAILDRGGHPAAFSITEQGRILPAARPFDFSSEYASVTVYGTVSVLTDGDEKRRALEGLMAKYAPHLAPGVHYEPMPDEDVAQTSVFCLLIESRVGKHNIKPDDYPAYSYGGTSFIERERTAGRTTVRPKEIA
jgi:nitroimidazol reductase NimA-like FMN-containing flavoprotein (pyridoxamine 5'-phosphate oxidase superfamily)